MLRNSRCKGQTHLTSRSLEVSRKHTVAHPNIAKAWLTKSFSKKRNAPTFGGESKAFMCFSPSVGSRPPSLADSQSSNEPSERSKEQQRRRSCVAGREARGLTRGPGPGRSSLVVETRVVFTREARELRAVTPPPPPPPHDCPAAPLATLSLSSRRLSGPARGLDVDVCGTKAEPWTVSLTLTSMTCQEDHGGTCEE